MSVDESQTESPASLFLVPIQRNGSVRGIAEPSPLARDVLGQTAALYLTVGFQEPWIGYLALLGGRVAGTCAFKSAPADGRVEIAYFTFPDFERRGVATSMVRELVAIARANDPALTVAAQTLPQLNVSTRVLANAGFRRSGSVQHAEDGEVWEWRLAP
jgi:ribosomal-protein-alanine N-acetyltransferase